RFTHHDPHCPQIMIEQYDKEEIYCRKLGHHLAFKYCRTEREGFPCSKILDCWFERFPVEEFVRKNYSEAEVAAINAPPRPKVATLFDLIEKAKNREKQGVGGNGRDEDG
ncbi:MAG: hypothetical protein U9N73_09935, partial [Candidatus Auribacterota bacterium]|nr:hypothetical protein [Candidatus Auribacterota bacterium]